MCRERMLSLQRRNRRVRPYRVLQVLAATHTMLVVLAGCTVFPFDGARVDDQDDPIDFEGYHWKPGVDVDVQAFNWSTDNYETITTATTNTTAAFTFSDGPVYKWSVSQALDTAHWEDAWRGQHARIRTVGAAGTFGTDFDFGRRRWMSCLNENNTRRGFYDNCASDGSPDARVLSPDYCEGPPLWEPYRISSVNFRTTRNYRRIGVVSVLVNMTHPNAVHEGHAARLVSTEVVSDLAARATLDCEETNRWEQSEAGVTGIELQCFIQIGDFSSNGEQHFSNECGFLDWINGSPEFELHSPPVLGADTPCESGVQVAQGRLIQRRRGIPRANQRIPVLIPIPGMTGRACV